MTTALRLTFIVTLTCLSGCTTDVSRDSELRGGYSTGQLLRLRGPAIVYEFDKIYHPGERGLHVDLAGDLKMEEAGVRAQWEKRMSCTVVSVLPARAVLRVARIECASTLDTAEIVPRAVILEGELRGKVVAISALSRFVPSRGYPHPLAPDPEKVEVVRGMAD